MLLVKGICSSEIKRKELSMAKVDINSIVADVKKLYAKDAKAQKMLSTGSVVKQDYKPEDGVPLSEGNPIRELLGLPCLPFNKIVEVSGGPDVGKSTTCGQAMASAQANDIVVVLWESESKFDSHRFKTQLNGNPDEIILISTNEILQGGEKVRKVITTIKDKYPTAKILFAWDSIGGSQSRGHAEKELDNEKHNAPGQAAKENGDVMRMLVGLINKYPNDIAVLLLNQVYAKIGYNAFGNQESGGKKIEFHSSAIIELKRLKVLTKVSKGVKIKHGIQTRGTVKKNHLNQGATSIHQLDFEITATGATVSADQTGGDDEST